MSVEVLPVWRFQADWGAQVTETLEWLTDVLTSPTGAEQRRSLRTSPRRYFEFEMVVDRFERSLLDNLLVSYGSSAWWLPAWHDPHAITGVVGAGSSTLPVTGTANSELKVGDPVFISAGDAFIYDLAELSNVSSSTIGLVTPTTKVWRPGAVVYPAVKCRMVEQPKLSRRSDSVIRAPVKWRVEQSGDADATGQIISELSDTYRGYSVLNKEPESSEALDFEFSRMIEDLDNETALAPYQVDTAGRPFTMQLYSWFLRGRAEHAAFKTMLRGLRGRAVPFWLPTFFSDFTLAQPSSQGSSTITVASAGFTESGGVRPDRRDVRVLFADGSSIYRRITDSAAGSGIEVLALDQPLAVSLAPQQVQQISFMVLSRLDQDSIDIQHITDIEGVGRVSASMRSAQDIRIYGSGGA